MRSEVSARSDLRPREEAVSSRRPAGWNIRLRMEGPSHRNRRRNGRTPDSAWRGLAVAIGSLGMTWRTTPRGGPRHRDVRLAGTSDSTWRGRAIAMREEEAAGLRLRVEGYSRCDWKSRNDPTYDSKRRAVSSRRPDGWNSRLRMEGPSHRNERRRSGWTPTPRGGL